MKKILSLVTVLVLSLSLMACSTTITYSWEETAPWGESSGTYEKTEYDVTIYQRVSSGNEYINGEVLANGKYSFTLTQKKEDVSGINVDVTELETAFEVKYNSLDANGRDKDKTDTVASKVRFVTGGGAPLSSYKKYTEAPRTNDKGEYIENYSYEYTANYSDKTVNFKKNKTISESGAVPDAYNVTETFPLNGKFAFDNEQVYFMVRYLSNVKAKSSASLSVSNIYDIQKSKNKKNKYSNATMTASATEALSEYDFGNILDKFNWESKEEKGSKIDCMTVNLALSGSNAGPSTTLIMTNAPTEFTHNKNTNLKVKKIIAEISYRRYDLVTFKESHLYSFKINSYTTDKT